VQSPLPVSGGARGHPETTPLLPPPLLPGGHPCGGPSPSQVPRSGPPEPSGMGQGEHTRPLCCPLLSVCPSRSLLLYIPRFTCLCFLSSMLWQWCSMLMRQCVVQPQAVIFQVISRVLNTRLLLFHLPSSRLGFPLHVPRLLLAGSHTGSLVEEPDLRPLLLPSRAAGGAPGRVGRRASVGPRGEGLLHERCLPPVPSPLQTGSLGGRALLGGDPEEGTPLCPLWVPGPQCSEPAAPVRLGASPGVLWSPGPYARVRRDAGSTHWLVWRSPALHTRLPASWGPEDAFC